LFSRDKVLGRLIAHHDTDHDLTLADPGGQGRARPVDRIRSKGVAPRESQKRLWRGRVHHDAVSAA
jgi:hypothetical protein